MSQRNKRLVKKVRILSEQLQKEVDLQEAIENVSGLLQNLNNEYDNLWKEYHDCMAYVYKDNDDNAEIFYDLLVLPTNEEIEVVILRTDDEVVVSYNGLTGKAKRHEQDEFDFEIGYNLAASRLLVEYYQNKYSKE